MAPPPFTPLHNNNNLAAPSSAASTCLAPLSTQVSAAPSLLESLESRTKDLWTLHMALLTEMKEVLRANLLKDQQIQALKEQHERLEWEWSQSEHQEQLIKEHLVSLRGKLQAIKMISYVQIDLRELKEAVKVLVLKLLSEQEGLLEREDSIKEQLEQAQAMMRQIQPAVQPLNFDFLAELRSLIQVLLKRNDLTPIIRTIVRIEQLSTAFETPALNLGRLPHLAQQLSLNLSQAHAKFVNIVGEKNKLISLLQSRQADQVSQVHRLQADKAALSNEVEELRLLSHRLEGDLTSHHKIIQTLKQRHEQLIKDHGKETDFLRAQLHTLERGFEQRTHLETELARLKARNHELEQELRETRTVLDDTRDQLDTMREEKEATPKTKRQRLEGKENSAIAVKDAPVNSPAIRSLAANSLANSPARFNSPRPQDHFLIAFTGVPKRERHADLVRELKGEVHEGGEFPPQLTHVVAPLGHSSLKTLAAALASKWIVPPEWIKASGEAGHWLPESEFGGVRFDGPMARPFRAKSFYPTTAYRTQHQSSPLLPTYFLPILIEKLGKGHLLKEPTGADYILIADTEASNGDPKRITLDQFLAMIPGHADRHE